MAEVHECRVIMVVEKTPIQPIVPRSSRISTYCCNVLDNAQIRTMTDQIQHDLGTGTIDILIENGRPLKQHADEYSSENCKQFIESTSQNIMSTINVSLTYINQWYNLLY